MSKGSGAKKRPSPVKRGNREHRGEMIERIAAISAVMKTPVPRSMKRKTNRYPVEKVRTAI